MTTPPVKSITEDQLDEIAAHNLRDAFQRAEARGYYGPPADQYAEQVYGGRVLQVLRYRKQDCRA